MPRVFKFFSGKSDLSTFDGDLYLVEVFFVLKKFQ